MSNEEYDDMLNDLEPLPQKWEVLAKICVDKLKFHIKDLKSMRIRVRDTNNQQKYLLIAFSKHILGTSTQKKKHYGTL